MTINYILAYFLLTLLVCALYLLIRNMFVYKCRRKIIDAMLIYNLGSLKAFESDYYNGHILPSYTRMLFSFKLLTPKYWLSKEDYTKLFKTR